MTTTGKNFRIFVSSTFADMQEERNALHRKVFPTLQEECARHGARFQAIDLRWGVSAEAGLDQKTMPLCLAEIERCQRTDRPNFLVLLGDRYGWRPLPVTIHANEFEQILTHAPDELPEPPYQPAPDALLSDSYASWNPTPEQLLRDWYILDENAVPQVYVLRPREKDGIYGVTANLNDTEDWRRVEYYLGLILRQIVGSLGFSDAEMVKYLASATDQEIEAGALTVPDAAEHVFCFFRKIKGLPHDKTSEQFEDIVEGHVDQNAATQLKELKERLRRHVPRNVKSYEASWAADDGHPTVEHIDKLCDDVLQRIGGAIRQRFAEDIGKTAFEAELEAHERFGQERAKVFIGRAEPLRVIAEYIRTRPGRLMVVHGESGSGKSALMAKASMEAAPVGGNLALRFVGATAASSDGRAFLSDLCRQIGRFYDDVSEVPGDYRELVQEFPKRLDLATAAQPLTVLLDALDQFGIADPARSLTWLPAQLPEHVALVVSTLPGATFDALEAKRPEVEFVEMEPMPNNEADELLSIWLHDVHRTLQPEQRTEVLRNFQQSGLPLYLKLAFEEARRWRSEGDHRGLAGSVTGLIRDNLFDRLDDPENHGEVLVSRAIGYLAASRYGLAEDELLNLLSRDDKVITWIRHESARTRQQLPEVAEGEQRIPVVLWSRLYADLEPYLIERAAEGASVLTFYHRQFGEVARDTYLGDGIKGELHAALARYFRSKVDNDDDGTWVGLDLRGLSELPYHLTEANDWEGVENVLTDFRFLERKVAEVGIVEQSTADGNPTKLYTGVYQLLDDFDHVLAHTAGQGSDQRHQIIVTAVNLGNGLKIRCPHCNRMIPWKEEYRDQVMACPEQGCGGALKVNPFVVGERA